MTSTLHYSEPNNAVLAICMAAELSGAELHLKQAAASQPAGVVLPSPTVGLPALVTSSGTVVQDPSASITLIGALAARCYALSLPSDDAHLQTICHNSITSHTLVACRQQLTAPNTWWCATSQLRCVQRPGGYAGGEALVPPGRRAEVQQRLEYFATTLAPALVQSQTDLDVSQALQGLEAQLQEQPQSAAQALTAADVRLGCCLLAQGCTVQGKAKVLVEVRHACL